MYENLIGQELDLETLLLDCEEYPHESYGCNWCKFVDKLSLKRLGKSDPKRKEEKIGKEILEEKVKV